ncbi:MAG: hypothetical protein KGZ39_03935 [Simkania sp.]|nr:hypothetical protein [Simkania sp.]
MQRDFLTNEKLKSLFKSNFELANYTMSLARYKVMAGHEVNVDDLLEEVLTQSHHYTALELAQLTEEAKKKYQEQAAHERGHERK